MTEALAQMIDKALGADGASNGNGAVAPFDTVSVGSFSDHAPRPRQWIVADLIPDRNVTDAAGDGGTGKSLLALQLGVAMVTGTDWLGYMPTPGGVLYVSCEDELDEIHRRIAAIVDASNGRVSLADLGDLRILDLTSAGQTEFAIAEKQRLSFTELFRRFEETVRALRPKLAIIDTRADTFGGSEIDRVQVRGFVRELRRLCLQHDMAILLLSHPSVAGMATNTGQSGSTAWGNSVRSRLYLESPKAQDGIKPDPTLRILTAKKANYGPGDISIALRWQAGAFRLESTMTTSTLDRIARDRRVEERFLELLRKFEMEGQTVNATAGSNYAPTQFAARDVGKIGKSQFTAAMHRLFDAGKIKNVPKRGGSKIIEVAW